MFHHRIASRDGQSVHMDELRAALTEQGHDLVTVGPKALARTDFGKGGSGVAALRRLLPGAFGEAAELAYNLVAFGRLWRAIRRHRPDAIYERYNLYMLAGCWASRVSGVPLLLEVNAPLAAERASFGGLAWPRLAAACEGWTWRTADHVLPVSAVLAEMITRAGVPRERISVVHNGVDPKRFAVMPPGQAKQDIGIPDHIVLGFVGFAREWHRLDRIVELLADRPDLHFLVVGDGPVASDLRQLAAQTGVGGRLTITGVVPRGGVARYVAAIDVALLPGVTAYASPLKLFEYMAMAKAIIAPRQANLAEILSDGENALLFDPASAASLTSAVDRICDDEALRERLGAAARRSIFERGLLWSGNARRVAGLAANLRRRGDPKRVREGAAPA